LAGSVGESAFTCNVAFGRNYMDMIAPNIQNA